MITVRAQVWGLHDEMGEIKVVGKKDHCERAELGTKGM